MSDPPATKVRRTEAPPSAAADSGVAPKGDAPAHAPADPESYEAQHVHGVYDHIAPHFSSTRYKPWPQVEAFVQALPQNALMLDIGSGNGKNLGLAPAAVTDIGCDRSIELLKIARHRGCESVRADGLALPFRSGSCDAVLSIAVVHHFATPERRLAAVRELYRLLRPGGALLVYVWAVEQSKDRGGADVLIKWEVHHRYDDDGAVYQRYYHLFKQGELAALCAAVGDGAVVERVFFDKENWCAVLRRPVAVVATADTDTH
jgi:tRNA (uracil-5-)-methyltransferase TRM9